MTTHLPVRVVPSRLAGDRASNCRSVSTGIPTSSIRRQATRQASSCETCGARHRTRSDRSSGTELAAGGTFIHSMVQHPGVLGAAGSAPHFNTLRAVISADLPGTTSRPCEGSWRLRLVPVPSRQCGVAVWQCGSAIACWVRCQAVCLVASDRRWTAVQPHGVVYCWGVPARTRTHAVKPASSPITHCRRATVQPADHRSPDRTTRPTVSRYSR